MGNTTDLSDEGVGDTLVSIPSRSASGHERVDAIGAGDAHWIGIAGFLVKPHRARRALKRGSFRYGSHFGSTGR